MKKKTQPKRKRLPRISVEVTSRQQERYRDAWDASGKMLFSEWVRAALDAAADLELTK